MKVLILFRNFFYISCHSVDCNCHCHSPFVPSPYQSNEWNLCIRFSHLTLCIAHVLALLFRINHVMNGHLSIGHFSCFELYCECCVFLKGLIKSQVRKRSICRSWQHHLVCCKQNLVLYWSAFSVLCWYVSLKFVDFFLFFGNVFFVLEKKQPDFITT